MTLSIKAIKRICLISMFSAMPPGPIFAGAYSNFPLARLSDLKPFTRDLGGLMGSGMNQTARILGFSGFDLGFRGTTQLAPEEKNGILKKNHPFSLGWVQAEIGMPFRIDGFIRAGSYDSIALAGGGLKYGLTKPLDEPYRTQAMIVAMGNMATQKYFYATQFSASLFFSINLPHLAPYFSAGFDNTKLTVQSGTVDTSLIRKKIYAMEQRYTFGLRAKFKLGYISGGVTRTHSRTLVSAGAGLRF
ncbi:MAG: hypothetical protein HY796_05445 [Elusimicrobia bacterium]|nr:hypothetical protein [Elusimicrobiota bacterium]